MTPFRVASRNFLFVGFPIFFNYFLSWPVFWISFPIITVLVFTKYGVDNQPSPWIPSDSPPLNMLPQSYNNQFCHHYIISLMQLSVNFEPLKLRSNNTLAKKNRSIPISIQKFFYDEKCSKKLFSFLFFSSNFKIP